MLSRIIEKLNRRFGANLTERDRIALRNSSTIRAGLLDLQKSAVSSECLMRMKRFGEDEMLVETQ